MQRRPAETVSYKTVLLRAADEASFGRTLSGAVQLGRAFGAHLVGLATLPRALRTPAGPHAIPVQGQSDGFRRAAEVEHARLVRTFRHRCEAEALAADWIVADPDSSRSWAAATTVTRSADLIVAPTPPAMRGPPPREHDAEDLLLCSGRPLMLFPRGAELRGHPERILVAWNASCEAARAVFDALPLLLSARAVTIASVAAHRARSSDSGAADLVIALQRHGVTALINEIDVAVPEVGTALLAAAKADGSELLVMGGYGRARFADLVLGRTTRHVLDHTHVPVLISH